MFFLQPRLLLRPEMFGFLDSEVLDRYSSKEKCVAPKSLHSTAVLSFFPKASKHQYGSHWWNVRDLGYCLHCISFFNFPFWDEHQAFKSPFFRSWGEKKSWMHIYRSLRMVAVPLIMPEIGRCFPSFVLSRLKKLSPIGILLGKQVAKLGSLASSSWGALWTLRDGV